MVLVLSLFASASCFSATNGTIGALVYLRQTAGSSGLDRGLLIFQQLATAILLAVHHVNQGDASVVGTVTASMIPQGFSLRYKMSDTHSDQSYAVRALLDWRCEQGAQDYQCPKPQNYSGASNDLTAYQAPLNAPLDAIVGPFRSEESAAVCNLASALGMKLFPIISYSSVLPEMADKVRYPTFSRVAPSLRPAGSGIIRLFSNLGWKSCAVLYVRDPWGNGFVSDFTSQVWGGRAFVPL